MDQEAARKAYEEALPLYRKAGIVQGEANCVFGLGKIALVRMDQEAARRAFEVALALYREASAVVGEALSEDALKRLPPKGLS